MIQVQGISKTFYIAKRDKCVIEALKHLVKREYAAVKALDNVSFNIKQGEIVGYIGPNGAGKSTTIKIISGILVPDQGTCNILGYTPWKDRKEYVKHIGVVFGQRTQLWWDVPVIDSYELLKDIYKIPTNTYQNNLELLTNTLELKELLYKPVRQLSLGERMRCEIGASLLHDPKILFLDEPTIGLDAVSKKAVRNFIKTINQEKQVTVILTTHDMRDIEELVNRIILIGKGKILLDGSLNEVKLKFGGEKTILITYSNQHKPFDFPVERINGNQLRLLIDTNKQSLPQIIDMVSEYVQIEDIDINHLPIEDIIVKLYKEYQL
ncbi:MAG: ATP-binding cassette domain-containing protein [Bacilli bacterium]|nr:ATP-binding cassette domain-containing protein [Bacilli bacterium]